MPIRRFKHPDDIWILAKKILYIIGQWVLSSCPVVINFIHLNNPYSSAYGWFITSVWLQDHASTFSGLRMSTHLSICRLRTEKAQNKWTAPEFHGNKFCHLVSAWKLDQLWMLAFKPLCLRDIIRLSLPTGSRWVFLMDLRSMFENICELCIYKWEISGLC